MERAEWDVVTRSKLAAFLGVAGLFFLLVLKCEPGFVFIVDHANLLFHEAGHPIVGLFSRRLEPYGGTLGQLLFPVVLAVSFWRKGQTLSFAGAVIWFFENGLNIARYMADARQQELPLVGGGHHDWHEILSRWNLLQHDAALGAAVQVIAWLGMVAACLWVVWRARRDRDRIAPQSHPASATWSRP